MANNIAWSRSNIIFAAHPTRPQLHGQLVPPNPKLRPSHRFDLPLPQTVSDSSAIFDSPTCLAVADDDAHLFAFFPPSVLGMEDGVCCVWERGPELTSWAIKEYWRSERGNDVVASRWIENGRRWSYDEEKNGDPSKPRFLPRTGPRTLGAPVLLTVTQLEEVQLHHQSPFAIGSSRCYNHIRATLRSPVDVAEDEVQNPPVMIHSALGQSVCTHATIGFLYAESSIIIAWSSVTLPAPPGDLLHGLPSDGEEHVDVFDDFTSSSSVRLCEVEINLQGPSRYISTNPLPLLPAKFDTEDSPDTHWVIASLDLVPIIPAVESTVFNEEKAKLRLLVQGICRTHKTQVQLRTWDIKKGTHSGSDPAISDLTNDWIVMPLNELSLAEEISYAVLPNPADNPGLLVLRVLPKSVSRQDDSPGSKEKEKTEQAAILCRYNLADLSQNDRFSEISVSSVPNHLQEYGPTFIVPSPNESLVALRNGLFLSSKLSILTCPPAMNAAPTTPGLDDNPELPSAASRHLSSTLTNALLNSYDPCDLVRAYWLLSSSTNDHPSSLSSNPTTVSIPTFVRGTLEQLRRVQKPPKAGSSQPKSTQEDAYERSWPLLSGFLVALYKSSPDSRTQKRWSTMMALSEVFACVRAFDETLAFILPDANGVVKYQDAGISWQLGVLCSWVISFCEDLVRDALRYEASRVWMSTGNAADQLDEEATYTLLRFFLLRLPLAQLRKLFLAVQKTRGYLRTGSTRDTVLNAVLKQVESALDSSPLKFDQLASLFERVDDQLKKAIELNPSLEAILENMLIEQSLSPKVTPLLSSILASVSSSLIFATPTSKTHLLVPVSVLLDIPLVLRQLTDVSLASKDILSKTPLSRVGASTAIGLRVCIRCGSRAELRWMDRQTRALGTVVNGAGWLAYVNDWEGNCVCGGSWIVEPAAP